MQAINLSGLVLVILAIAGFVEAHMALIQPSARQVVNKVGLIQGSYTTFGGHGDVYGNNGNIFGGPRGSEFIKQYGYEVCGDDPRRNAFKIPSAFGFAPTAPQMTIDAGKTFEVLVRFTTHHLGWMEFRLCAPRPGQRVVTEDTPECFREHVLELDPHQHYNGADMATGIRSVFDFEGTPEAGYNYHHAKCQQGPPDTCCDPRSGCSPENANVHRFVLPRPGVDNNEFRVRLKAPAGVTCDRCTLQVTYRTGNSPDSYPETFWNCADIAIRNGIPGATSSPTTQQTSTGSPTVAQVTKSPVASPTNPPTLTPTKTPTTPTTPSPTSEKACGETWKQCGGIGFTGGECCSVPGDICVFQNDYWSMCTPPNALPQNSGTTRSPTLRPTAPPTNAGCGKTWEQCGGNGFNGNKCCALANDECAYENEWWSMCRPRQS